MYIIRGRHYTEDQIQEMMERKNNYYHELIKNMSPKDLVPGGRELIQEIRDAGIKAAIGSASKNCRTVLDSLQITDLFDGIADGNSVVNSKPAPDLFVYAAGLVKVPTPDCMGVEDADAGIEAIKTAGMQAIGIGPKERFHRADKVLPSLANKHLNDLLD
jgi:beta-phosphoglucomutase